MESMDTSDESCLKREASSLESGDHECDSSSTLKRHRAVADENKPVKQEAAPLIVQKHTVLNKMPKVTHAKPKAVHHQQQQQQQPRHLDKIVNNLKINLLHQMSKKQPREEEMGESLKKHELFIRIVETLGAPNGESHPDDDYDDLTDLTWLTNFNLSKEMGPHFALGCCLSPPQSPPSANLG